jgi:tetratricopeptide (TPR) repeat protein
VPPTVAEILLTGQHYQRAGALARAEQLYRQAVDADPAHAESWALLGSVCQAQGRADEAAEHYRQALRLQPDLPSAHNGLGIALARRGDLAGAEAHFRRAVGLRPGYAQALNNLANVLKEAGRPDEALACYEEAGRREPGFATAHTNRGLLLLDLGRAAEAEASCREAVRLCPGSAGAHSGLGGALAAQRRWAEAAASCREALRLAPDLAEAHANLGAALAGAGQAEAALQSLREAVRLRPQSAAAHQTLGGVLAEQGQLDQALAHLREAVRLAPGSAPAQSALGQALLAHGDLGPALAHGREAVRLRPESADAHAALGVVLAEQGRLDEALACSARALALDPDHPEAHRNRALVWLQQGDFARGWPEYEWRWRCRELPPRPFPQPRWDGGPLEGKTILLHAEQGLGDTVQFVRYAPLVKARGGRVIVVCQRPLLRLLESCPGIDRLLAQGDPLPAFDVQAPLLSLPLLFGTDLSSIPAKVPYLHPDPALVERWRGPLAARPGFKVGIAWQGSGRHRRDRVRSIPLEHFEVLARVGGVRLVSLQKGPGSEQRRALAGLFPVAELPGLDERAGPFLETAAVLPSLDLVVCCDSAVGHLAGALGVPCWLALPFAPDWRWLLGREDSPWYPRHRLFRQDRPGDWDGVFRRLADALRERAGETTPAAPPAPPALLVEVSAGELLDKITILEIKSERIRDPAKLGNVRAELAALEGARRALPGSPEVAALAAELKAVNEALWQIEDDIRGCERAGDFGPRFVALARAVYRSNDRRAALKRRVNELSGSRLVEEKSYADDGR